MPKNGVQKNPKVGFISRIDYGSPGYRRAIVESVFKITEKEQTDFNLLVGGLIYRDFSKDIDNSVKIQLEREKDKKVAFKHLEGLTSRKRRDTRKGELLERYLKKAAKELSKAIPVIKMADPENPKKEKFVDLFITTSPAFDGEYGEMLAQYLAELRTDVRVWGQGGDRLLVKYVDKIIWALAPQKAVWMRGDYYSTAVERVIKDKIKQTTQKSPDLYAVGCFGSSINKPKGELEYQYLSLPNASRIEETRVSENQIGVRIIEFPLDGSSYLTRTYSLKDVVAKELSFITPPPRATHNQKKIIEVIKARGSATPGTLKYVLDLPIEQVMCELESLQKKKTLRKSGENWPSIGEFSGKKYYFDLEWIKHNLKYDLSNGHYSEDKLAVSGCIHSGSTESDTEFLLNDFPQRILKNDMRIWVDSGDIMEGLKHGLDRKQEVLPGMNNNTVQELYAAHCRGSVILQVFQERFSKLMAASEKDKSGVAGLVEKSLMPYYYRTGNHDTWVAEDGNIPLAVFHLELNNLLTQEIEKFLSSQKLPFSNIRDIVKSHIIQTKFFTLSSGLKVSMQHPYMSRAQTTSIRPQEMLRYAKRHGCQVAIGANFHVSECVEEWDMNLGQCVSMEIGTMKHGSDFERNKMKMVDQGIGYLRILSSNQRVFMTESAFYGGVRKAPINNLDLVNERIKRLGLVPLPDFNTSNPA